jgi:two-component system LytT family response regulator
MIKVAVIEDSQVTQQQIIEIINGLNMGNTYTIQGHIFSSSEEFLYHSKYSQFEILIVDIDLPGISGLELVKQLQAAKNNALIVFLTSYDYYMKDAFGINVHKYLLKSEMESKLSDVIHQLINNYIIKRKQYLLLKIQEDNKEIKFYEDDIICILFEARRPFVITEESKHGVVGKSLSDFEEELQQDCFIKINKGTIINVNYIESLSTTFIKLKHIDTYLPVSRGRYTFIKDLLINYSMKGESL